MSRTTLTAIDICKMFPSVFNRECGLYITDGTLEKDCCAYREYRAFFDANPHRRIHIFQTTWHQFDMIEDPAIYSQLPYQYVKVEQLSSGIYECSQRYFGRKYAQHILDARSDVDIARILLRMQADRGMDKEMELFLTQVEENSQKTLKVIPAQDMPEVSSPQAEAKW